MAHPQFPSIADDLPTIKSIPLNLVPAPTWKQLAKQLLRVKPKPVVATSKHQLKRLINEQIQAYGPACDLNHIDVSNITNMRELFERSPFVGDISQWDVSNVTDMSSMFHASPFDGDLSQWNTSRVIYMSHMFKSSYFNGNIATWDTSSVTDMFSMFCYSDFNQDISSWNVSNVRTMTRMFYGSVFRGDIAQWDISEECSINYTAPPHYGKNPLFLTAALYDQKSHVPNLEPYYSRALSVVQSLGVEGLDAGRMMFEMIHQMQHHEVFPTANECGLTDFT